MDTSQEKCIEQPETLDLDITRTLEIGLKLRLAP
jgi:hypothetical protein